MKELTKLAKVSARYGLIGGALGGVLLVILYYVGRHPFLILPFFDFRVILFSIFIFFSLKEYKEFHGDGILYFWQGMIGSFVLVAVYALTAALLILVFELIEPDFLTTYIHLQLERLNALTPEEVERVGKEVIQRNLDALPATNIFELPMLYIVQSFGIGLFISIILSVILRKQP